MIWELRVAHTRYSADEWWLQRCQQHDCDQRFSKLFQEMVQAITCRVQPMFPCRVAGVRTVLDLSSANEVQLSVTGMVLQPVMDDTHHGSSGAGPQSVESDQECSHKEPHELDADEPAMQVFGDDDFSAGLTSPSLVPLGLRSPAPDLANEAPELLTLKQAPKQSFVELTPLSHIPGKEAKRNGHLGYVSLVLIKEVVKGAVIDRDGAGGLKANCFTTLAEAHSMLRSIVLSRGGNALLNCTMQECVILQTKQDMYSLLHFYGDAVAMEPLACI